MTWKTLRAQCKILWQHICHSLWLDGQKRILRSFRGKIFGEYKKWFHMIMILYELWQIHFCISMWIQSFGGTKKVWGTVTTFGVIISHAEIRRNYTFGDSTKNWNMKTWRNYKDFLQEAPLKFGDRHGSFGKSYLMDWQMTIYFWELWQCIN